jgi:histidyl-tRNA synthetase
MDALLAKAPHIVDYLCDDCADHFGQLRNLLDELGQSYTVNFRLVRGIDYYTKTVFELWDQAIGAQASLCGGGRYDGLAEAIGGSSTPAVGVGIGIERIAIGLKQQGIDPPLIAKPSIMIANFGGRTKNVAVEILYKLRQSGIDARMAFARERRSMKSQMREANRYHAEYTIIIGETELSSESVTVRNMNNGEQELVQIADLINWLNTALNWPVGNHGFH